MNIYKTILKQKHLSGDQKHAICTIIVEWDSYRQCQRKAKAIGKYNLTLRKLFAKDTGVTLPYFCWWNTQEDLLKQFKIK